MAFAPTRLTLADAGETVRAGCEAIAAGDDQIDLSGLQRFDSSALAALLAWRRAGAERGHAVRITHLPPGLLSMARVYGVVHLLDA